MIDGGYSGHLPLLQESAPAIVIGLGIIIVMAFFTIIDWILYVLKWVAKIFGFILTGSAVLYIVWSILMWTLHEVVPHLKL